jgi:hypothetical protein
VPHAKPRVYDQDELATPTKIFERSSSRGLDFSTENAKRPLYFIQKCRDPILMDWQFLRRSFLALLVSRLRSRVFSETASGSVCLRPRGGDSEFV